MDFKTVINISGKPGLYHIVSSSKTTFVAESLDSSKKRFSVAGTSKIAALSEISIFTHDDQVRLLDVLKMMQEQQATLPLPSAQASDAEVRSYFTQILPEHDPKRVYVSDVRKIIKWYGILEPHFDFATIDLSVAQA